MRTIFLSMTILMLGAVTASAQQPRHCVSYQGFSVPYIADPTLNNVGIATHDFYGRPIIIMNPQVLNQFPPLAREFWFAHECAHHALPPWQNSEDAADCYAIQAMRWLGMLNNPAEVNQFFASLSGLPGNIWTGHRPGPGRIQLMQTCLANSN